MSQRSCSSQTASSHARARPARFVVAAVLVLAGAGCGDSTDGSDQESATEAWADEVCSTVGNWKDAIAEAQNTLGDTSNLSANAVQEVFDDVATATETLVTDLKNVGSPDTEAGDQAKQRLSTLSGQLAEQDSIVKDAMNEGHSTLSGLLAQVSTVTGALATMIADAVATLDDIRQLDGAAELEGAFTSAPACQDLRATESPSGG